MLDAAAADGVTRLFATSHSTPGMEPFPRDVYQRHLDFARAYCAEKGYDLMLESGSELLYTPAAAYAAAEHSLVTLGGTDWVLLAHIERYPRLARSGALPRLKEQFGLELDSKKLVLPDAIKSFGSYQVKAKLGFEISGLVNVLVCEAK